jgi:hypothetical protein
MRRQPGGNKYRNQAIPVGDDIGPMQYAFSLAATLLAERQQAAKPGVGRAICRVDQNGNLFGQIEPAADDQSDAGRLRRCMGSDNSGQAVAIADGKCWHVHACCLRKQFLAGAGPAQEGKMRGALQFDVRRGHPKMPCRNQR